MLATARRVSSSCTGAMTSEMSLATIEAIINTSSDAPFTVQYTPVSCHESWASLIIVFFRFLFGMNPRNQPFKAQCYVYLTGNLFRG